MSESFEHFLNNNLMAIKIIRTCANQAALGESNILAKVSRSCSPRFEVVSCEGQLRPPKCLSVSGDEPLTPTAVNSIVE